MLGFHPKAHDVIDEIYRTVRLCQSKGLKIRCFVAELDASLVVLPGAFTASEKTSNLAHIWGEEVWVRYVNPYQLYESDRTKGYAIRVSFDI